MAGSPVITFTVNYTAPVDPDPDPSLPTSTYGSGSPVVTFQIVEEEYVERYIATTTGWKPAEFRKVATSSGWV